MIACQNCGHPAHCDGPLWIQSNALQDGGDYHYKACECCRCDNCTPAVEVKDEKKDIPTSFLNGL